MLLFAADIAKDDFESFDGKDSLKCLNSPEGVDKFVAALPPGATLALEPTSTYSDLLARKAYEAGHTVYMVQPSWIKAYRKSKKGRAKTDRVDARLIHEYVMDNVKDLHPWRPLEARLAQLKELVRQRCAAADELARLRQTFRSLKLDPKLMNPLLAAHENLKKELDKRIAKALKQFPEADVLLSIKGIGNLIAATILVPLLHLGFKSADSFIGFIGIDPVPQDSGNKNGIRRISKKGDSYLRRALYMAALGACRTKTWKPRYERLRAKGLKPKQALIALAKKIATTAYHIFRMQVDFDPAMVALKD
jgi:transposase